MTKSSRVQKKNIWFTRVATVGLLVGVALVSSVNSAQAVLPGGVAAKPVVFKKSFALTADLTADQNVTVGKDKNGNTTVKFSIKNLGNNATPAFKVSVVLRGSGANATLVSSADNGIDGKGVILTTSTFAKTAVDKLKTLTSVDVTVDSTNVVTESNEKNNKVTIALGKVPEPQKQLALLVSKPSFVSNIPGAVPAAPASVVSNNSIKAIFGSSTPANIDFEVGGIWVNAIPDDSANFLVTYTLKNNGSSVSVPGVRASAVATFRNGTSTSLYATLNYAVTPGKTVTDGAPLVLKGDFTQLREIQFTIDDNNTVVETNENNNVRKITWPLPPELKSPTNGERNVSVTPELTWLDRGPGKNYFRFYLLDSSTNVKVWEREFAPRQKDNEVCDDAFNRWLCTTVTVPLGTVKYDKTYRWSVEAGNDDLMSGYATSSEFTVKSDYIPSPSGGATNATPACLGGSWDGSQCVCPGVKTWHPEMDPPQCSQGS